VKEPRLWSAEHPNLYNLKIEIRDGDKVTETVTRRIGIREITNKDGVLLLNGVPIKMAGMCRHDVHAEKGTAVDESVWRRDLELMREANINAVRTSHYPYGSGFYDLCDEMGFYVADELPYCWCPTDDPELTPAFLQRARETVRRDKLHPSVIIWAVGNENKEGRSLQAVADLVKELDPTRLRAVSWFNFDKYNTELSDSHYTIAANMQESADKARQNKHPHIYLENPNVWDIRLGADASCWDAWSQVLMRCWDVVEKNDVIPGTFVWEWQDRAVTDHSPVKNYRLDAATGVHYMKIKGIVDSYRNPRPEHYHLKMIFAPLKIRGEAEISQTPAASFEIENHYSFTDLSELDTKWQLLGGGKILESGSAKLKLAPLTKGKVELPLPADAVKAADSLRVDFQHADAHVVVSHQFPLKPQEVKSSLDAKLPPGLQFPQFNLVTRVTKGDPQWWRKVTRFPAKLRNVTFLPAAGEKAAGDPLLNDVNKMDAQVVVEDKVVGTVHAEYANNLFRYRFEWTGPKTQVQELGWRFRMPRDFDHFSWNRKALWTVYPDTHIGRPIGTATPDSADVPLTKISRPDAFDFNSTKYNCNFASLTNSAGGGLGVEFTPDAAHHGRGGIVEDAYQLFVNKHVSVPDDISTKGVPDLVLTLSPGDKIEGSFRVGGVKKKN
jgi:beta-galactosidase/beta-glucuronidase